MTCQVTGEVSDKKNLSLADGKIVLSTEGAEAVFKRITTISCSCKVIVIKKARRLAGQGVVALILYS
ncbi:hypothetical protein GCM10020331_019190 [Ectobacillus funiculus]